MTPTPAPVQLQRLRTAIAAGLLWICAHGFAGSPSPLHAPDDEVQDWHVWRSHLLVLLEQDAGSALSRLRLQHERARERGDRHAEWLNTAWLARETARWEHGQSAPWLTLAEQALQAAQRAGDGVASFELLVATEGVRLEQQIDGVREGRLAQAEALAAVVSQRMV